MEIRIHLDCVQAVQPQVILKMRCWRNFGTVHILKILDYFQNLWSKREDLDAIERQLSGNNQDNFTLSATSAFGRNDVAKQREISAGAAACCLIKANSGRRIDGWIRAAADRRTAARVPLMTEFSIALVRVAQTSHVTLTQPDHPMLDPCMPLAQSSPYRWKTVDPHNVWNFPEGEFGKELGWSTVDTFIAWYRNTRKEWPCVHRKCLHRLRNSNGAGAFYETQIVGYASCVGAFCSRRWPMKHSPSCR